jgi:small subunit ribosomal protein S1
MDSNENLSMESFLNEIDKSMKTIHPGDIVTGSVISINDNEVLVNIGYMTDGVISGEELDNINVGDEISVYILQVNDGEGNVALSKKKADSKVAFKAIKKAFNEGTTLSAKITKSIKGGVSCDINGVTAFMPVSQLSTSFVENTDAFVGKEVDVKIIDLDESKHRLVISAKEIEKEKLAVKKEALWETLKKGEKRTGVVTRLAKFGAFVDLGGLDGLIHLNDMSWKRIMKPEEVVSVGDTVSVFVLDFDKEKNRISLGLKDADQDPWNFVNAKYKIGSVVEGTVVKLLDFGAIVKLDDSVEGLVHISEISEERITKPSDVLSLNSNVKVKVLNIDDEKQRLSLSIKEAVEKPSIDLSEFNDNSNDVSLGDLFGDKFKNFKF